MELVGKRDDHLAHLGRHVVQRVHERLDQRHIEALRGGHLEGRGVAGVGGRVIERN